MKIRIKTEVKIGLIFVIALVAFIWGLGYLKGTNLAKNNATYFAYFDDVLGLTDASPVTIQGLQVGKVSSRKLSDNGKVLVSISIEQRYKLPKGTRMEVISDIMGYKSVSLCLTNENNHYKPGDTLRGNMSPSLLDDFATNIAPIKNKTEDVLTHVDSLLVDIQNGQARKDLVITLNNLTLITAQLNKLLDSKVSNIATNLEEITDSLNSKMTHLNNTLTSVDLITNKVSQSAIIESTDTSLYHLQEVMEKVNNGEGTLGLLVNDDSLYINLTNSLGELDLLLKDLQENPKKYVNVSVF